jgi:hypothetical protein
MDGERGERRMKKRKETEEKLSEDVSDHAGHQAVAERRREPVDQTDKKSRKSSGTTRAFDGG